MKKKLPHDLQRQEETPDTHYTLGPGRAIEIILIPITQNFNSGFENFGEVFLFVLDISKTFDKVWLEAGRLQRSL